MAMKAAQIMSSGVECSRATLALSILHTADIWLTKR